MLRSWRNAAKQRDTVWHTWVQCTSPGMSRRRCPDHVPRTPGRRSMSRLSMWRLEVGSGDDWSCTTADPSSIVLSWSRLDCIQSATYVVDTSSYCRWEIIDMWRWTRAVDLCVIGVLVWGQTMALNQRSQVGDIQNEQNWPKHRAMWNAAKLFNQGNGRRPYASATDKLPTARQIRPEPVLCDVGDPKARFQTLKMSWTRGLPCQMPPTGPEGPGRQSRHGRRQGGCQTRRRGRQTRWSDLAGSRTVVVAGDQRPSSMSSADAPRSVQVISTVPTDWRWVDRRRRRWGRGPTSSYNSCLFRKHYCTGITCAYCLSHKIFFIHCRNEIKGSQIFAVAI